MTLSSISKKILKILAFILGGILLLLVAFHFWFINHAEQLIEEMVDSRSNGKIKLEVRKFKFNWFSRKIELRDAVFYTADTSTAITAYHFKVKNIRMMIKAVRPIIFEEKLMFDSLLLTEPDITVTRLRPAKNLLSGSDTTLSLPQEMGRVYNSIQQALQVLQVTRFQIDKGKFSLINKMRVNESPVSVSNIHLSLDHLEVDSSKATTKDKILFSKNVVLTTHDQNILFPDRRHRLSFSKFHINVLDRSVQFDSCTVQASKGDSAATSFSIFFDKLKMINVDFDTLYHNEVIKADSVYCINPRFQLNADLKKRTDQSKPPPTLNELVQQLMGDMDLAYVSVQNGSFDINTMREGRPSSFTSDHNSFELQGLRVNQNAARPLVVEKFVMAIHNYENFLRDSAYAMQFDSIFINNDKINLSNFAYQELKNNRAINDLVMPRFELRGLSWDDLVFSQRLKARNVTLYQPVINYDFSLNTNKKQNIFQSLRDIGKILRLNNLHVVDGQINLLFKNNAKLRLEHADINVLGNELVNSRKYNSLRQSVTDLHFSKGFLEMNDLSAELSNVQFSGTNNRLKAEAIHIKNKNNLDVNSGNVTISSMIIDDDMRQLIINDIDWDKADIRFYISPGSVTSSSQSFILNNFKGSNTKIDIDNKGRNISGFFRNVSADRIASSKGEIEITRLTADGNNFKIADSVFVLEIQAMKFTDLQSSTLRNLRYKRISGNDKIEASIPAMTFSPDINALINGKIYINDISLFRPDLQMEINRLAETEKKSGQPEVKINNIIIKEPQLFFVSNTEEGNKKIEWKRINSDNFFEMENLVINNQGPKNISAGRLVFSLSNFLYNNTEGRSFDPGKGHLTGKISNFTMQQTEIGGWDWHGNLDELDAMNFTVDSLGKQAGTLVIESATIHDLSISSSLLLNIRELIRQNIGFDLGNVTGSYHNNLNKFNWHNAGYNKRTKYFFADSFSYSPAMEKDSFVAAYPYRADYIRLKTGLITAGPFDIDRYLNDTILDASTIRVHDIDMYDFRDHRLPLRTGIVRSLPIDALKKIRIPFSADTLKIINAHVDYEELNEKTHLPGIISVKRLNTDFINVRNYNFSPNDSLYIIASAFLEDSILMNLYVEESYADPKGGFKMQLQINNANPAILNPTLKPLAPVELLSGHVDSLTVNATGNNDVAYGKIRMIYHDFKVKLYAVKKGQLTTPRLLNFLGNTIIKNKNRKKESDIFFVRLKNRSVINYLLKISLNGVMTTIGLKNNKKDIRKYKKSTR